MEPSPTRSKPEVPFSLEKSPDTQDIEEGTVHQYGQPALPIDEALESKLRWKMDLRILPTVTIIYLLCFIDRANIGEHIKTLTLEHISHDSVGNAKIAGLEADLKMQGYDFNISLSIFYISYILFEIPLNLLCKRIGPGWFIPACCLGFGICTTCTAFVNDFSTLCGLRFLLGIFEAAMLPANVYYLSRWYRRSELTFRLSFVIISASLAGAFGGLLASAILRLESFGSLHSWRMIFAIEVGVISFFTLTDRVETATWLSPEQKELANIRIMSERVGTTEIIDKFGTKRMLRGILNPVVIPTAVISFFNFITVHGLSFFLPTIVRTIFPQHSVQNQQLLTVPPNVLGTIMCMLFCYISWKVDKRGIFLIICAPFSMIGYSMFLATSNPHVRYAATFLPVCGIFALGAFPNAHVSANVISDTSRSSAVAFNVMLGNIGGLVSTWAFLPFDGPEYRIGNGLNLAAQSSIFLVGICMYFAIERSNKRRSAVDVERELAGKTFSEIQDLEWRHPGFRWQN
ncbi:major facilitator superfamily transporter [Fusarium subglutinans]|uniref:Major facilitator superfamily transporter n=1 Tax=Gibberella subglutinans TaxID=42677 RepID=A0A8H5L748_GIBSU|nr:major facilitator superfamily transporter [Fusarium subglutinans]KAF5585416.1 major facilitator superfamily transporter [Fusarium subglutinans]